MLTEIFFEPIFSAKKHLKSIINIDPGNPMVIGLCGFQEISK